MSWSQSVFMKPNKINLFMIHLVLPTCIMHLEIFTCYHCCIPLATMSSSSRFWLKLWEMMKKKEYFHHLDLMKVVRNDEEKNSMYLLFGCKLQLALFPLSQSHVLSFKLHHLNLHQRCDDDWWRKELCHHLDLDQSCVGEWWRKTVACINFVHLANCTHYFDHMY